MVSNIWLKNFVQKILKQILKQIFNNFWTNFKKLLKQKDAYPYEYMDSFKRFNEEKLPNKKCFTVP